jgi:hypothetical protein
MWLYVFWGLFGREDRIRQELTGINLTAPFLAVHAAFSGCP